MTAIWEPWEIDIYEKQKLAKEYKMHHRAYITRAKQQRLRICFSILSNYYSFSFNKDHREQCSENRKRLFLQPKALLRCQKYRSKYGDLICVWEGERPQCPRCWAASFYPKQFRPSKCTHEEVRWIE